MDLGIVPPLEKPEFAVHIHLLAVEDVFRHDARRKDVDKRGQPGAGP
jgi:hypothetical protein